MSASPQSDTRATRGWRILLVIGLVYTAIVAAVVVVRTVPAVGLTDYDEIRAATTSDFRDFWWTARHFCETGKLTADFGVHNYLPFFPLFMLPWSLLPLPVAAAAFSALSLVLFGVAIALTYNLLANGSRSPPRTWLIITAVLLLPYVHSCAVMGNVGLLMAFLVVATWFLVERGREWEAGAALGLAALIKLLPALLVIFFLLKRRWRVAGGAASVVLLLGLGLPLGMLGLDQTARQHQAFFDTAVRQHSAYQTIMTDKPGKAYYKNSALPMILRRLLTPLNASGTDEPFYVNALTLPRAVVLAVFVIVVVTALFVTTVVTLRGPPSWPPPDPSDGQAVRGQFAAWCCLALISSPLVWAHYLPLCLWPLALAARNALRRNRTRPIAMVVLVCWILGAAALASPLARAAGAQLAPVLLLWIAAIVTGAAQRDA